MNRGTEQGAVVVAVGYDGSADDAMDWAHRRGVPLALGVLQIDLAPVAHDTIISACVRAGFSPRIAQEAVNDQSILGIVACGLAVAIVPEATTRLRLDGVVDRPLSDSLAVTPLSVIVSATATSPIGTAFRDAVITGAG